MTATITITTIIIIIYTSLQRPPSGGAAGSDGVHWVFIYRCAAGARSWDPLRGRATAGRLPRRPHWRSTAPGSGPSPPSGPCRGQAGTWQRSEATTFRPDPRPYCRVACWRHTWGTMAPDLPGHSLGRFLLLFFVGFFFFFLWNKRKGKVCWNEGFIEMWKRLWVSGFQNREKGVV